MDVAGKVADQGAPWLLITCGPPPERTKKLRTGHGRVDRLVDPRSFMVNAIPRWVTDAVHLAGSGDHRCGGREPLPPPGGSRVLK